MWCINQKKEELLNAKLQFFTNISHSISYYAFKVKEKLNFDYSNLNVKEPCTDLEKLTIYEEEEEKKNNKNSSILEDNDLDEIENNFETIQINQLL